MHVGMRGCKLGDWVGGVVVGLLLVGTIAGGGIEIEGEDDILQGDLDSCMVGCWCLVGVCG